MVTIRRTRAFRDWLNGLADVATIERVNRRLDAARDGHFGDVAPVGGGVSEMRIHIGPGYRVYFTRVGREIVWLLAGGDKSTQSRDIARAKAIAREIRETRP